jgi:hypothetical protein
MVETITAQPNMIIYACSCGKQILIVPDISKMGKAISNHVIEHNKSKKKHLTEEALTQKILNKIANNSTEQPYKQALF